MSKLDGVIKIAAGSAIGCAGLFVPREFFTNSNNLACNEAWGCYDIKTYERIPFDKFISSCFYDALGNSVLPLSLLIGGAVIVASGIIDLTNEPAL